jgi:hypothetical protein
VSALELSTMGKSVLPGRYQFRLWHLFAWLTFNAVMIGCLVGVPWHGTWRLLLVALAFRLLLLAVVAPIIGLLRGQLTTSIVAGLITIVAIDFLTLGLTLATLQPLMTAGVALNMTLLTVIVICPVAAIRRHGNAIATGLSIGIVLACLPVLIFLFAVYGLGMKFHGQLIFIYPFVGLAIMFYATMATWLTRFVIMVATFLKQRRATRNHASTQPLKKQC